MASAFVHSYDSYVLCTWACVCLKNHHVFVHVWQMSRDLPNLARYVCWQIPGWDAKPTSPKPIRGRGPQRNSWQSINKPRRICHLFIIMLGWCQNFIPTNPCRKVNMFLGLLGERKQWSQTSRVLRETKFYDFSALRCLDSCGCWKYIWKYRDMVFGKVRCNSPMNFWHFFELSTSRSTLKCYVGISHTPCPMAMVSLEIVALRVLLRWCAAF